VVQPNQLVFNVRTGGSFGRELPLLSAGIATNAFDFSPNPLCLPLIVLCLLEQFLGT
jgi:hypothetical protein